MESDEEEQKFICSHLPTRTCPKSFGMKCEDFPYPCARFESDAEWPWEDHYDTDIR